MDTKVIINTRYSKQVMRDMTYFMSLRMFKMMPLILIAVMALSLLISSVFQGQFNTVLAGLYALFLLIILGFYFLFGKKLVRKSADRTADRNYARNDALQKDPRVHIEISDTGMCTESKATGEVTEYSWDQIPKCFESLACFYFFVGPQAAVAVPKKDIVNVGEAPVRRLAKAHLGDKRFKSYSY